MCASLSGPKMQTPTATLTNVQSSTSLMGVQEHCCLRFSDRQPMKSMGQGALCVHFDLPTIQLFNSSTPEDTALT